MKTVYLVILNRADWMARFGHLPSDPLSGYDGPGLYNKRTGDYCGTQRAELCTPHVIRDCPDHIGPSGRIVHGRAGKREEIARSDGTLCDWEPVTNMPRGLANEEFARRHGAALKRDNALVKLCDKSQAFMDAQMKAIDDGLADPLTGKVKPKRKPRGRDDVLERKQRDVLNKLGVTT